MKLNFLPAALSLFAMMNGCDSNSHTTRPAGEAGGSMKLETKVFGALPDGREAMLYTLANAQGTLVEVTNYGAYVKSILTPDKAGVREDILLGYDDLKGYLEDKPFMGCVVGRYGNRIARGKFTLDGKTYSLATNNGPNHLHGGVAGFNKKLWAGEEVRGPDWVGVKLTMASPDGDEGYPGNLKVAVTYKLTEGNELQIAYEARTDQATPVNLTNHAYFNLSGGAKRDILGHELELAAGHITPVDATLIPTGELLPVEGTPFDFRSAAPVGARIGEAHPQILFANGYDHNWVFTKADGSLRRQGKLKDPVSGRTMEMWTQEPGVQFYTGNFLDGTVRGKGGKLYGIRSGLCLETQHFPDSPNQANFPSTILRPGEVYATVTVYKFGVE